MILRQFSEFQIFFIVGLDIQQKLNVLYSGTEIPNYMSDDGSGLRPQQSDPQSKIQGQYTTSAPDEGTTQSMTSDKAEI